jgi:uncharacterized protein
MINGVAGLLYDKNDRRKGKGDNFVAYSLLGRSTGNQHGTKRQSRRIKMDRPDHSTFPAATLFNTHVRTLTSSRGEIDYEIGIWLPENYASGQTIYPVLYLLDGNVNFGMATDLTPILREDNEIPELIIVGISYPIKSYADWLKYRLRDYSPTRIPRPEETGGASQFLEFVETQLIPFIDAQYRTNSTDRTLFGYSLGGTFVVYTFLKRPALFQRYVAGSPALNYDESVLFQYEAELAQSRSALPARLAMLVGEFDDFRRDVERFSTLLQSRNYEGLQFKTFVLDGETHASGVASAYIRGLTAAFR